MILYFERKADKDGKRRLEVMVEELDAQCGKLYLTSQFRHTEASKVTSRLISTQRELSIREAILYYDDNLSALWPEEYGLVNVSPC